MARYKNRKFDSVFSRHSMSDIVSTPRSLMYGVMLTTVDSAICKVITDTTKNLINQNLSRGLTSEFFTPLFMQTEGFPVKKGS
jgi:hypothetical protein